MATVDKNFRIKNGLVVEGSTATINGQNILTETGGDQYILDLIGGETLVKSVDNVVFSVDGSGNLTVNANVFDSYGSASAAQAAAEATAAADATTKANAAQAAAEATAAADATTKANAAQAAAEATAAADATTKANAAQAAAEATAQGYANQAEQNANDYTDDRETAITAAYQLYADQAETDANSYADSLINDASTTSTNTWSAYKIDAEIGAAVSNLVDSAPEVLDTLNELAAALADNPNYATDMAAQLGSKQDTLTAGDGIELSSNTVSAKLGTGLEIDGSGQIAVNRTTVDTWYDAAGDAAAAQSAAEATAQAALDDVLDSTTPFESMNINDVAKQVAARVTSLGSVAVTAYQFNKSTFRSGKFLVKIDNGTHNEISEILVTLDSSDNVAITEYAIVGTNGSRGTITADVDGTHCRIRVNPVNDSTITISGTIFNA